MAHPEGLEPPFVLIRSQVPYPLGDGCVQADYIKTRLGHEQPIAEANSFNVAEEHLLMRLRSLLPG